MSDSFAIRPASPEDVEVILGMVRELAEYEKLLHECVATEGQFHEALFGESPVSEALLGELGGAPISFALFFHSFSTFVGKPGLYLEDLYVKPPYRGRGFGQAFLRKLAQIAVERDCGRFEWTVLDWNEPAIRAYDRIGATALNDWTIRRLEGANLKKLANEA
ncbi:MAG: GNAT family N-acetyltransferase [Opitutales bacterium]